MLACMLGVQACAAGVHARTATASAPRMPGSRQQAAAYSCSSLPSWPSLPPTRPHALRCILETAELPARPAGQGEPRAAGRIHGTAAQQGRALACPPACLPVAACCSAESGRRRCRSGRCCRGVSGLHSAPPSCLPTTPTPARHWPATCRPQTADISAQNLGDEGFAYIVDALPFNDRCVGRG